MAFDSSVVKCFVYEANNILLNSKIDKIHQPQKDELSINLRLHNGSKKLYISANAGYPRIFLTDMKSENPAVPPMFCMLLRKHLTGGKITSIKQIGFERIIEISVETYDDLMDITTKKIIVEIMGKHSNIILTENDGTIIDSIKRIDLSTSSVRQVLPGLKYIMPPAPEKESPLDFADESPSLDSTDVEKFVLSRFYGISKLTAAEIAYKSRYDRIYNVMTDIFGKIKNNEFKPCIIYDKDGFPFDFNVIEITQFQDNYTVEYDSSISKIIETFYYKKALKMRITQSAADLSKIVNNNISRCRKKLAIFEKQLLDAEKKDKYIMYGDLITANLYRIEENTDSVEVENYFDENLGLIKIPLDNTISPARNAQKYYAKYNKMKTAEIQAEKWINIANEELAYLESVADEIQRISDISDIAEIKAELVEQGYIISQVTKKKKVQEQSKPLYFQFEDYEIFVGKNNKQNDYLTLKTARSKDLWFHTKDIPGSHVVVRKKENEEIPDSVIVYAAKLAASHSKAKGGAKIPVDYTTIKNVKKPSGAKPGMVIYDNYNTIYINS